MLGRWPALPERGRTEAENHYDYGEQTPTIGQAGRAIGSCGWLLLVVPTTRFFRRGHASIVPDCDEPAHVSRGRNEVAVFARM